MPRAIFHATAASVAVAIGILSSICPAPNLVRAAGPASIAPVGDQPADSIGLSTDGATVLLVRVDGSIAVTGVGAIPTLLPFHDSSLTAAMNGAASIVVFPSAARLTVDDGDDAVDLYRWDVGGALTRLPSAVSGTDVHVGSISDDGRYVAVDVLRGSPAHPEAEVVDTSTGASIGLRATVSDFPGTTFDSTSASISNDGNAAAFVVRGDRPGCVNCSSLVARWDRATNNSTIVSVGTDGRPTTGFLASGAISGDGDHVGFVATSPNLPNPFTGTPPARLYVYDVATHRTEPVLTDLATTAGGELQLSDDGSRVTFETAVQPRVGEPVHSSAHVALRSCNQWRAMSATAGGEVENGVIGHVAISGDGRVAGFTSLSSNLLAPASGARPWAYPFVGSVTGCDTFTATSPFRVLDTRPDAVTVDGRAAGGGAVVAGSVLRLPIVGRGRIGEGTEVIVPSAAVAVVVNVTVTDAAGPGFLTVYPCGADRPNAANLNFVAHQVAGNDIIASIGAGGEICIFSYATTHVVADLSGWFIDGGGFHATVPQRLVESRTTAPRTVDGLTSGFGRLAAGSTLHVPMYDRGGLSHRTGTVALNVAAIDPDAAGFLTVYPCDAPRPLAASLNFGGVTISNTVVVGVPPNPLEFVGASPGTVAEVCIFASQSTDLAVDLIAGFDASNAREVGTDALISGPVVALVPARLLDTRAGQPTIDGAASGGGVRHGDSTLSLQVAGRGGVPTGARAVILEVVAVADAQQTGAGFLTAYPCTISQVPTVGTVIQPSRPLAASLNHAFQQTVANNVVVPLTASGAVCIYSYGATHVVVDVVGTL